MHGCGALLAFSQLPLASQCVFANHFAAKGHFRSEGAFLQPNSQPKGDFAANGHFHSCEIVVWGCEMALVCQRRVSQLRKFSQGVAMGLRNHFVAEGHFRSQPLISLRAPCGCKIISQQMAIFAGAYFGLRNFADHWNFLLLSSFWLPKTFFHFFCNSS